jgi:ATP-dependent DNA ligase
MNLSKLYSRATNSKINEFTIEVEGNKYRTISGYQGMKLTTSQWTICEGKNIGKKNETTPEQQAELEAKAIHRKKIETGCFENVDDIDIETYFEPMLAHDFTKLKSKIKYPVYSQPKLDGIRCIVRKDGMWSRNGKKIVSAPHIFEALKPLFKTNPDLIFDGELYADKFANDFNAICSLVKKTKPTAEDLKESASKIEYHIYDLPSCKDTFVKRHITLNEMDLPKCCVKVRTEIVSSEENLMMLYDIYVSEGYEGQMVRIIDSFYENKRSKSLLKHKSFIDEEYTILDIEEGKGNKAGMVGSFVFKNKDGKQFNASPKFNWEICMGMWVNRMDLIGKEATVKYFNLTPDGVPRFGYVIKIDRSSYE